MNPKDIAIREDVAVTDDAILNSILGKISFDRSTLNFQWKFKARPFEMTVFDKERSESAKRKGWLVWAEFERPDIITGKIGVGRGRDEIIWHGTTLSGVVKTCWVLFHMLMQHEEMEGFRFDGVQIFNPHHTIGELELPTKLRGDKKVEDTYRIHD